MSSAPFLYPNVTSLPGQVGASQPGQVTKKQTEELKQGKEEFDKVLDKTLLGGSELGQVRQPLKISAHATQRLADRKIKFDDATMAKVNEAVDKAAAKGLEDTLVLTGDAAFIVSVKNRTVITALDRSQLSGNVFTNIDGAVII